MGPPYAKPQRLSEVDISGVAGQVDENCNQIFGNGTAEGPRKVS
jgi:hypothetical protein